MAQKITCREQVLGKNFKGKPTKEQRKQITKCKLKPLKKVVNKTRDFVKNPVITTKSGDTISLRSPIVRKQNK